MKEMVKNRRVLVTGGAGVIGQELLQLLSDNQADVLSVDRRPLSRGEKSGVTHLRKDLAVDKLDELVDFQPEILFHLAATFERSKESPEFWKDNWLDNVLLSHRLCEQLKKMRDLKVLVFASSYLLYSTSLYLSPSVPRKVTYLKETDPILPRNLCGAAKHYTEGEIRFVREVESPSLRTVDARIFRVYGCGSKDVVSRWVRAALSGQEIRVYHKENRFDYVFAGDVAAGLLELAASPDAAGAVNLSYGTARRVEDVLSILQELVPACRSKIKYGDVDEPYEASGADISMLKKLTGWTPPTDLKRGIEILVDFEKSRENKT
jgi:carbamoyl-phosphate synthase large subunit